MIWSKTCSLRLRGVVPCLHQHTPAHQTTTPRRWHHPYSTQSHCGTLYSPINHSPTAGIRASMVKSIKTFLSQSPVLFKSIAFHTHSLHKQILVFIPASRTLPLGSLQHSSPQSPYSVLSLDVNFSERMFRCQHSSESASPLPTPTPQFIIYFSTSTAPVTLILAILLLFWRQGNTMV